MATSPKYIKRTGKNEMELGEAATPEVAERADMALQSILNPKRIPGNSKPVKVLSVSKAFDEKYADLVKNRPRVGQVYQSALEASISIGAHLASVTTALSKARRRSEKSATVRGVKFAFA